MKISTAHLLQLAIRDELDFLVARINSIVRMNDATIFTEDEASDVLDAIIDANSELAATLASFDYEHVKPETQPQPANKPQTPDKQSAGVSSGAGAVPECPYDTKEPVVPQYGFSETNRLLKETDKIWNEYIAKCNERNKTKNGAVPK